MYFAAIHNCEPLEFSRFKDVSLAFIALFSRLQKEIKRYCEFDIIKTACLSCAGDKLTEAIKNIRDVSSLFALFAENKAHCNWLNIRFLEVMATASGNSELTDLIDRYNNTINSKKLHEVWDHVPYHTVRTKYYSELKIIFKGIDPDNVTVIQFKKMCEPYLINEIAMLIAIIEKGSLKITWLIPTKAVYEAYLSALMIPQESRLDSHLQIGDWVVHHPLDVLQNLHKECCEYILLILIYHILYIISLHRFSFIFYFTNWLLS